MTILSNGMNERARKIESIILQHLAEKTQTAVALELNVSESKISRFKTDDLKELAIIISTLDLNMVPDDSLEASQAELLSIKTLARKYLEIDAMA